MSTRTNLKIAPLIVSFALLITASTFAGNIIYVDDDAAPSGDGKSWETAFTYLQDALATALSDDEIHVAQGVYKPDQGAGITPGNREATFQLIRGVRRVTLKGGYAGAGTKDPNARNIGFYKCVLSGDLNGDDGPDFANNGENSYHVVCPGSETTLDGFIITAGNANGSYWMNRDGGGIRLFWSHDVKIYNCIIRGNTTSGFGGGIYLGDSDATLINCVFSGNQAGNSGGALFGDTSDGSTYATLTNCTFNSNSAWNVCGGIHMLYVDGVTLTNCILWGNFDSTGMDELAQIYSDDVVANYSCIQGWTGNLRGISTIGADPLFVDADGADNVFGTKDDNFRLLSGSPCIDAGDNLFGIEPEDFTGPPVLIDLDGNPRIVDDPNTQDTGYGTPPVVDMGAYEFQRPCIIFVDDDANGANDGSSWADAYNYLQDALAACCSSDEIRVAQGVYTPDQGAGITPGDKTATFQLISGVTLKGGYAGSGEPDPNARDIDLYETILTGDLAGDDGPEFANNGDNSYHVVTCSGTDATAVLDGFIITGGNAGGPYPHGNGGGMNGSGGPTLRNCTIRDNFSLGSGAGIRSSTPGRPILYSCRLIRNLSGDGSGGGISGRKPTMINCTVSGNSAFWGGGGVSCDGGIMINCMFNGNRSERNGGGMFFCDCTPGPTLINCTFSSNTATQMGGGIYMPHSGVNLLNCILWGNSDINGMYESSQIYANEPIVVDYSCIQGLTGVLGGIGNIGADPCFVDPDTGDYHLLPDSPSINAGDPNYIAEPNETDLDGNPRVICGRIDMGAYECQCTIIAEARIVPQTINLASKGNYITSYIWLPEEYDVADIEPNSILLEDQIQPDEFSVDKQRQVARARFSREEVQQILEVGQVELTITGQLNDRTSFEATDIIKVTDKAGK